MRHNHINNDDHWAVSSSTFFLPSEQPWVLVQLQEKGEQVRVAMTAEQAENMAEALLNHAKKIREAHPVVRSENVLSLVDRHEIFWEEFCNQSNKGINGNGE